MSYLDSGSGKEKLADQLSFPGEEELRTGSMKKMHGVWRQNHQLLLDRATTGEIPFFGLHGTGHRDPELLKSAYIMLATYDQNPDPDRGLVNLHRIALYAMTYGFIRAVDPAHPGKILLFHLPEGTLLKSRLSVVVSPHPLQDDSNEERAFLSAWADDCPGKNGSFEASMTLTPKRFDQLFVGSIDCQDLKKYKNIQDMGRAYMALRFAAQDIVGQSLDILDGE